MSKSGWRALYLVVERKEGRAEEPAEVQHVHPARDRDHETNGILEHVEDFTKGPCLVSGLLKKFIAFVGFLKLSTSLNSV